MTDTNQALCEKILGNVIETVAVDYDNQTITLYTDQGLIEFSGDDLRMYVEVEKLNQSHFGTCLGHADIKERWDFGGSPTIQSCIY